MGRSYVCQTGPLDVSPLQIRIFPLTPLANWVLTSLLVILKISSPLPAPAVFDTCYLTAESYAASKNDFELTPGGFGNLPDGMVYRTDAT